MHAHTFVDYARDRLSTAFPEWLSWLRGVYGSKDRMAAAVESFGQRFHSISVDELEHIVCLVLQGKRQRPRPEVLIEELANYVERIQQDQRKRQQAAGLRHEAVTVRQAMEGPPDEWDWRDRYAAAKYYTRVARNGGTAEVPCYDPRSWPAVQACVRRLMEASGLADVDVSRDEYARRLAAAGIVRDETGELVQRAPASETWDGAEVAEQLYAASGNATDNQEDQCGEWADDTAFPDSGRQNEAEMHDMRADVLGGQDEP